MKGFIKERTLQMLTYQHSSKALLIVQFQDLKMVSLKFAAVICLVYFTVFVNAGKRPTCKTVLARLDEMESLCQGTFRNVFYFADVSNGLNLSFSVIVNLQLVSSN